MQPLLCFSFFFLILGAATLSADDLSTPGRPRRLPTATLDAPIPTPEKPAVPPPFGHFGFLPESGLSNGTKPKSQRPLLGAPEPVGENGLGQRSNAGETTAGVGKGQPADGSPYWTTPPVPAPVVTLAPSSPRPTRFWAQVDYLSWWMSRPQTPPLVTTGPQASGGFLDDPNTQVLFGGRPDLGQFSGGRITLGSWFDPCQRCGVEGSYFFLNQRRISFAAGSNGDPLLARPFIDAMTGLPAVEQVANLADPNNPGLLPLMGRVAVDMTSALQVADLNLRFNCLQGCFTGHCGPGSQYRIDLLAGLRYLQLGEGLRNQEDLLVPATGGPLGGSRFQIVEEFNTINRFYGGQIGVRAQFEQKRLLFGIVAKVAVGATTQRVQINGSSTIDDPLNPPVVTLPGGLLALPSNIGTYNRTVFSVVPELGLNLGYKIHEHVVLRAGYTLLYWSNVARPGDQIDIRVNPNQLPPGATGVGPRLPEFRFNGADLWVHGVNFGVEFRY